jgi:phosphoribosylanthranilate isomerase
VIVQIYGVTTTEDARLVGDHGPDHVGIVLDEGIETWDQVDEATAKEIAAALAGTTVIGLSLSTDPGRIARTVAVLAPDIVNRARAADYLEPKTVSALRRQLAPVKMMVTVPVRGPEAVDVARRFAGCCDYLLADTVHPTTGVVGATGRVHDWSISARIVQAVEVPVILAGGLGPENVVEAIERVRPAGVDSETRTSREDDPRRKDGDKVRRFIQLARAWERG